jgi:hypothetical protein
MEMQQIFFLQMKLDLSCEVKAFTINLMTSSAKFPTKCAIVKLSFSSTRQILLPTRHWPARCSAAPDIHTADEERIVDTE